MQTQSSMNNQNLRHLPVLLVDDEPQLLQSVKLLLRSDGFETVYTLGNSQEVMALLAEKPVKAVVLDLTMPGLSGFELLQQISLNYPELPVIIMTGNNEIDTAVQCMKTGAYDFLVKPVGKERLISSVYRALEVHALQNEVDLLKHSLLTGEVKNQNAVKNIVTQNSAMHAIFRYMEAIAPSNQPALITGETGSGKELFAKALHSFSGRSGAFIADNVAGLDDTVFADTLFGHTKGAYTGADRVREGLIAQAQDGTLFLDEIGDLTQTSQIKLLRLLQEHSYYPIGLDTTRHSNARIIVATHCDIDQLVEQGKFRKDLYYRLYAHRVHIPPLRDRLDDLAVLVQHILEKAAAALNKNTPTPPPELIALLKSYHFPGNIRELEGMIHNAVAIHQGGVLSMLSFREAIGYQKEIPQTQEEKTALDYSMNLFSDCIPTLKEAEQILIEQAMQRADNNQGIAAGMLGITRQALNKRLVRSKRL